MHNTNTDNGFGTPSYVRSRMSRRTRNRLSRENRDRVIISTREKVRTFFNKKNGWAFLAHKERQDQERFGDLLSPERCTEPNPVFS